MQPYRALAVVALAVSISGGWSSAFSAEVAGSAVILDGDTIKIGETRIRLVGIDAPETDQRCLDPAGKPWPCGIAAREAVSGLVAKRAVRCQWTDIDIYRRMLATCWVAAENINRWLVRQGLALAFIRYSSEYVDEEKQARDASRGMWSGAFIAPWAWRSRTRATPMLGSGALKASIENLFGQEDTPPDPACQIKGNVNRNGEQIFHMPGQHDYGRVSMKSTAKRWFCGEEEAIAAGWRKAKR